MKTLMPQRMESVIITMHALQMKEQPIKLETIANAMNKDMDLRATSHVVRELQARELIVKLGKARKTIYVLTKKAKDAIENKSLSNLIRVKPVQKTKTPCSNQNKINPTHVNFMKQMNQFLKDHENLLEENKSLKEENLVLKAKINQIKNLFNV